MGNAVVAVPIKKNGVGIWAIIDAVINVAFLIFLGLMAGIGGPKVWNIALIVADILLAVGTLMKNPNICLIIFWQIIMMIEIVLLFICWLLIPILLLVAVVVDEVSKACDDTNDWLENNDLEGYEHCNNDSVNDMQTVKTALLASIAIVIIMPIVYIYWWGGKLLEEVCGNEVHGCIANASWSSACYDYPAPAAACGWSSYGPTPSILLNE